jgi:hypothetical protein
MERGIERRDRQMPDKPWFNHTGIQRNQEEIEETKQKYG